MGELAARLGGGHDAELCEAALGVDLNGLAIAAAFGDEIPVTSCHLARAAGGACVRFLVAPEGTVGAVEGVERAETSRTASRGCACIASRATSPGRCARDRIAPAPCWPSARAASRRWHAVGAPRDAYAFALLRTAPPSRSPRETFLGFQPPAIGEEEIAAVAETLRSGWLTTGPKAAELERRFAEYVGAKHALAVTSGTAAMHLSLLALGVGPGDEVITTPITWPATANVIVHTGATPVFADVRASDLNIDPEQVAALVGPRTKAILPVHLAGQPADLDPLWALGLPVSRTPRTRSRASTAAARSGRSRLRRASRSTRRRTSPPARAASSRPTATTIAARDRRPSRHAARPRLALRHRRARLQGESLRRARGDRPLPAGQARAASRDPRCATSRPTTRRWRSSTGSSRSRATRATLHALHLYVVRIDPERAGATRDEYQQRAGRGADRDEHPLPPGAQAERVPGALSRTSRRCRSPSGPATRCCRCRCRPPTRTTTSRMRSTPCAACTRGSRGSDSVRQRRSVRVTRDARRHRPVSRLHRLEDRPRPDGRHPRRRRLLVPGGRGRDHDGDGAADGVALAAAAAGALHRRAASAG